jgi:hypothetical protein
MSRYRLEPTPEQESILLRHCSDARYVWNLCVEQENEYRPGRGGCQASDYPGRRVRAVAPRPALATSQRITARSGWCAPPPAAPLSAQGGG